jgi:bacteriocin biosynthesis cyclodehydratase domain-containing protein
VDNRELCDAIGQDVGMVLALDPGIQRVWRTPDSVQFGVERPVLVLDAVSPAEERMLAALAAGVTLPGLRMIASRAGADADAPAALLARLAPVLAAPARTSPTPPLVVLDGSGTTAAAMSGMLRENGIEVLSGLAWSDPAVSRADAAVIVASYAVDPQRHARWLRRDVPHLPIVFGDSGVAVGPFVEPGASPCLRCIDLRRTDSDPAWPAMASQLYRSLQPGEDRITSAAVAAHASAVLTARLVRGEPSVSGVSTRLEKGATAWVSREWRPHPECGCLGLPS